jgi:hypothetical protein
MASPEEQAIKNAINSLVHAKRHFKHKQTVREKLEEAERYVQIAIGLNEERH